MNGSIGGGVCSDCGPGLTGSESIESGEVVAVGSGVVMTVDDGELGLDNAVDAIGAAVELGFFGSETGCWLAVGVVHSVLFKGLSLGRHSILSVGFGFFAISVQNSSYFPSKI